MIENDICNMLVGIDFFIEVVEVKIFEFLFGEKFNFGIIQFGMIVIVNENDFFYVVFCLYMFNFKIVFIKGLYGDINLGFVI